MYWEALGLPGTALNQEIEGLAKWVQWALTAVEAGISESQVVVNDASRIDWINAALAAMPGGMTASVLFGDGGLLKSTNNEDIARYNLTQFWSEKGAVLAHCQTEEERRQVYRLDMLAHGTLGAIDTGKMYSASPSFWSFFKAALVGGTPPRPSTEALAAEARQAYADAADAASAAGIPSMAEFFGREEINVDRTITDSNTFWGQPGVLNVGGVPWFLWLAVGLIGFVVVRKYV
jgi:hypothetical protein